MSLLESSDVEFFGAGELVKWLSKPPEPLATQTHEPKMKVAPLGGVMVLKAKVAIELADELAESPIWRASCRCLPPSLLRDTLSSRIVRRDRLLWNSVVQGTQRFRQVRAASSVIPYVLCGCLYCLRC